MLQELAIDNLRLFIAEIIADVNSADPDDNPLNSETNLWVAVNRSTGTANVGYNLTDNARLTLDNLNNSYFGSLADRNAFNITISNARNFAAEQTAQQ